MSEINFEPRFNPNITTKFKGFLQPHFSKLRNFKTSKVRNFQKLKIIYIKYMKLKDIFDKKANKEAFKETHGTKRGTETMPTIEYRENAWQMDDMYYSLNGRMKAIFCAIETSTRIGFFKVYTSAQPTGKESFQMVNALRTYLKEHSPYVKSVDHISTDPGANFESNEFKKVLSEPIYYYQTGQTHEKSIIERFNLTVRLILNKYVEMVNPTWLKGVPEMIEFYNNRYHRSIQGAPFEMTRETVMFNTYTSATSERAEAYQKNLKSLNLERELESMNRRIQMYHINNRRKKIRLGKHRNVGRKRYLRYRVLAVEKSY